jgi:hypothetical protein
MSPKVPAKAAPSKKLQKAPAAAKASSAPAKAAAAPKAAPKSAKGNAEALAAKTPEGAPAPADGVDPDEAEEQADAAAARSSSAGGAEAAMAAAGTTEMSASFKNFRHHPDMENFYRFIYENDLRHEAAQIIDVIMVEKLSRRQLKTAKASAH